MNTSSTYQGPLPRDPALDFQPILSQLSERLPIPALARWRWRPAPRHLCSAVQWIHQPACRPHVGAARTAGAGLPYLVNSPLADACSEPARGADREQTAEGTKVRRAVEAENRSACTRTPPIPSKGL